MHDEGGRACSCSSRRRNLARSPSQAASSARAASSGDGSDCSAAMCACSSWIPCAGQPALGTSLRWRFKAPELPPPRLAC